MLFGWLSGGTTGAPLTMESSESAMMDLWMDVSRLGESYFSRAHDQWPEPRVWASATHNRDVTLNVSLSSKLTWDETTFQRSTSPHQQRPCLPKPNPARSGSGQNLVQDRGLSPAAELVCVTTLPKHRMHPQDSVRT